MGGLIDLTCGCGARYRVPDQLAGKRAQCKRCGAAVSIPLAAEPESYELAVQDEPAATTAQPRDPLRRPGQPAAAAAPARAARARGDRPVASYFKDCVGSVAFVAQAGNIVPFLVLAALSAMRPFMAYAPILGLFAGFIVSGWICSFLFNVVISAANGERELPELSITDGLFDSIVVPTFKFAASWAIVLLPALIYAIVAQVDSLAQTNPGDVVFYVLMAAGALFWPMTVLILAIGGAGSFGRPDLIFKTIARTFGPYLFTCLMAGAAFAVFWFVRIGLARTGAIESRLALACVLEVVQLYFEIVVMRFVGLYYYHFKSRFAWSWE